MPDPSAPSKMFERDQKTLNEDVQLLKSVKKRRDGLGLVAIGNDVIGCKHANASTASSPFMMMM